MKLIEVTNSIKSFMVDDKDEGRVNSHNWILSSPGSIIYTTINGIKINIGRFILDLTNYELEPDHKDRNIWNNQRENLRVATKSQNQCNRNIPSNNKSGFKGVSYQSARNQWIVQITFKGKRKTLGRYYDPILAAKKYNEEAIKLHGEFAVLNEF